MPTLTLSFAPHTRTADAAVRAPRKNLRVLGSDIVGLLFRANCIRYWVAACKLASGAGEALSSVPLAALIYNSFTHVPRFLMPPSLNIVLYRGPGPPKNLDLD